MGHLGSDGRPFSEQDMERLELALVSLLEQLPGTAPEALSLACLQEWHRTLSAGLARMQPGEFRGQDISFGSFLGTSPQNIMAELTALLAQHQAALPRLAASEEEVVWHATRTHAELIRIHPFWDGNGRLARAVQAWICWSYGLRAPRYTHRAAYLAGLNRYHHTRQMHLLMQVTWEALKTP